LWSQNFYKPDALAVAQPAAAEHWKTLGNEDRKLEDAWK